MLWGLPASVRALTCPARRCYSVASTAQGAPEPLKILFCGSDNFSITSLRALNDAKNNDPGLIESIEVVHRPGKPVGRGHKGWREGTCLLYP